MNFVESIKTCFVKYATFSGRASRSEFWYFCLFLVILDVSTEILDAALAGESFWSYDEFFGPITSIFYLVTFLPGLALSFRRLQDINKSGWWCFTAQSDLRAGHDRCWCWQCDQHRFHVRHDSTVTSGRLFSSKGRGY